VIKAVMQNSPLHQPRHQRRRKPLHGQLCSNITLTPLNPDNCAVSRPLLTEFEHPKGIPLKKVKKTPISQKLRGNLDSFLKSQPTDRRERTKSQSNTVKKAEKDGSDGNVHVQDQITKRLKRTEDGLQENPLHDYKLIKKLLEIAQIIPNYGRFFQCDWAGAFASSVHLDTYLNSVHQQINMEMLRQSFEFQCWLEKLKPQIKEEVD
jgi:hypothetical protein